MEEILKGTKILLIFGVVAELIVFIAMCADLASGLYKAKLRGEFKRSELLKRSGAKFSLYEGSMLIALCIDLLIHFTHLYEAIGLPRVMVHLPLISFGLAIFWCAVEYMSIREKADDKVHSKMAKVEKLAASMFTKEEMVQMLAQAITNAKQMDKESSASKESSNEHK